MTLRPLEAEAVPPVVAAAFERFWQAYPARSPNPKAQARQVFARLVAGGAEPERLVAAAETFAAECACKGIAAAFVPHARTWLYQRRYEDYLAIPQPLPLPEPEPAMPLNPHSATLKEAFRHLAEAEYRHFIAPLEVAIEAGRATVTAPSRFQADHVRSRWLGDIRRALGCREIRIEVRR
ncbi:DnaA N-terminal domain-containing protein [Benzoatithermus flavus]|uniref:DnaA N-terminal domain-containing protein n=1 Tax=Benzoatithermus flavus TaxID=3108223 RepID=A0ABU8XPA5_9PROT